MKSKPSGDASKAEGLVAILVYLLYLLSAGAIFGLNALPLEYLVFNALLLSIVYFAFLVVFGRRWMAYGMAGLVIYLAYYADICVYNARLTHIRASDFKLAAEALGVATHYSLVWTWEQMWRLGLIVILAVLIFFVSKSVGTEARATLRGNRMRGSALTFLTVVCVGVSVSTGFFVKAERFNMNREVSEMGLIGSWFNQAANSGGLQPEGYTKAKAEEVLATYVGNEAGIPAGEDLPEVIVVMNESLADYSLLGEVAFEDPLSELHELVHAGELFEGKLAVSVFGGGTCNTEWEFLTGNSLAFLPEDAYPFLSYVNDSSENIGREMGSIGYSTSFLHPYFSQEWNRKAVYGHLGFDTFRGGEDLGEGLLNAEDISNVTKMQKLEFGESLEYIRGFVSDSQAYEILMDESLHDGGVQPCFSFCVTIQNHGGYDYEGDDFVDTEFVDERTNKSSPHDMNEAMLARPKLVNQYLTLCSVSDDAFNEFLKSLAARKKKTIVLMFGDHQPAVTMSPYVEYQEWVNQIVEEETHVVPYFIWSNFDLDYEFPEYVSANYLSALLKDCAGLPLTPFDKYRLSAMDEIPVITTNYAFDREHKLVNADCEELRDYAMVQYMRMFDS